MNKVLITGARGMVGAALVRAFGPAAVGLGREDLDIADAQGLERLCGLHRPRAVVNAAGVNRGPALEIMDINARLPGKMAEVCARLGVGYVFLSSSRVFGRPGPGPWLESDAPQPVDDYGRSKFEGERLVRGAMSDRGCCVLRLPMVLGAPRRPQNQILTRLIEQARGGRPVRVAMDVMHSPLEVNDAARVIRSLVDRGASGTFHLASSDRASLYEIFSYATQRLGIAAKIIPVEAAWFGKDKALLNLSLASRVLEPCGDWRRAVERFAEDLQEEDR
ncbi:MAG: NAD(P)-dependent oxidoreductase [Desulfovibrionaceae bacterium]|nr:NAD(P)-dependent oxidoreductase [Desulfovibrionaceae bacterium]